MLSKGKIIYPQRGEIYLVNFDPTIGSEIKKTRPALILQNAAKNDDSWGKEYNNALTANLPNIVSAWIQANTFAGIRLDTIPGANNQRLNYIDYYWRTFFNT